MGIDWTYDAKTTMLLAYRRKLGTLPCRNRDTMLTALDEWTDTFNEANTVPIQNYYNELAKLFHNCPEVLYRQGDCNDGYMDTTNGTGHNWECANVCEGGNVVDGLCNCACMRVDCEIDTWPTVRLYHKDTHCNTDKNLG